MRLLDRYILRAHIGPFIFGASIVVFIFLFQFLRRAIDELVGKGLDVWVIIQLIILNLAWMVVLAVPIGVLFSTLMAFGGMSDSHEVTIVKASGGSLLRMMTPAIVAGALITVLLFWFNDRILPEANHQAKVLMSDIKRKKPTFSLESGRFSTDLEGYTILARKVDSASGILKGVTIYDRRKLNYVNIVSADTGIVEFNHDFTKLILTLFHGEIHQLVKNSLDNYKKIDFERHRIGISASGFSFVRSEEGRISRGDREMMISDMEEIKNESLSKAGQAEKRIKEQLNRHYDYITGGEILEGDSRKLQMDMLTSGDTTKYNALKEAEKRVTFLRSTIQSDAFQQAEYRKRSRQYEVEIQKKYAIPMACLIFVLVGCPLGIITRGGNFGVSAAITLGFYIIYWICLIGGEKLADRGFMSPVLSMWMGNIIIGVLGILLTIRVNYETITVPGWRRLKSLFTK